MSLDYRLHKAQLDLEFLLRSRDSNVIPNVFEEVKETTLTFEKKRLSNHQITFLIVVNCK